VQSAHLHPRQRRLEARRRAAGRVQTRGRPIRTDESRQARALADPGHASDGRARLMASKRFWGELRSSEFNDLDPQSTMAVLPVAAIEQHGPHLPVLTDTAIAEGMIATVLARLPDGLDVLFLPIQMIGKSNEHLRSPGTLTYSAENLIRIWVEIGEGVHRA